MKDTNLCIKFIILERCLHYVKLTPRIIKQKRTSDSCNVNLRLFCFGSLVILDVARCYLWLFTLYINIKIGKNSC